METDPQLELALAPVHQLAESMSDETCISSADTSTEVVVDETEKESEPPAVKETPPSRAVTPDRQQPTTVAVTAPSDDDASNQDEGDLATPVSNVDPEHTPRRVSHIKPRPHTFRSVVLRPPPRRVTQKKSYESIDSMASIKNNGGNSNRSSLLGPRSREIILTPVDSIDSMRSSEDKSSRRESGMSFDDRDRPASVISTTTVAFGV